MRLFVYTHYATTARNGRIWVSIVLWSNTYLIYIIQLSPFLMNPDCKTGGKGPRKFFILMLAFALCGAMAVTLFAADSTDDVEAYDPFEIVVDDVTYVITSGPGSFGDYRGYLKIGHPGNAEQRIEDLVTAIHPETGDEMKIRIVEIAADAYKGNTAITSIEITSWVTEIGANAFEGCTNLETVDNLDGDKSQIRNIGAGAFKDCISLRTVSFFGIESNVWTIGANAFENCTSLDLDYGLAPGQGGRLSKSLNTLGDEAFKGSGVTKVILADSSPSIGVGVFENCVYLTSATLSSNPSVQERMFKNSGLTSIDFPGGMFGSIGKSAFEGCTSLVTATFPTTAGGTTIQSIGDSAFKDCTALEVLQLSPYIEKIGANAFENCTSLEMVEFGDRPNLTEIGEAAFRGCIALEDVRILYNPDAFQPLTRISKIGVSAFEDCVALKSINLTPLLSVIGDYAFKGTGLTSVSIPFYPTLGEGVFMNCVDLETVVFESRRTSVQGTDIFAGCVKLDTVRMPSTVTTVNSSAFNDCEALEIIAIPLGATIAGDETMDGRIIVWFSGVTAGLTVWISEGDVHMAIEMAFDEIAEIITAGFTQEQMNVAVLGEGHARHMNIGTEKTVYVDVSIDDDGIIYIDGNSNWINIPIADLMAAKEAMDENPDIKELKIRTRDGTVSFDAEVLQYIIDELDGREEDVLSVSISRITYVYAIPQAVQNVVGDRPVYSITMNTTSTFGDGKLKISLKYDLLEGEKPRRVLIWHIDNSGVTTAHPCTYSEGYVRFETTHLSYYFVGYDDSPGNKILFEVDGGIYEEYTLDIGDLIVLPEDPVKQSTPQYDYEFIGWNGYTDGMRVTGEQRFVAEFRAILKEYKVTIINGDETIRKTLEYGTEIVLPTASKTATAEFTYNFESWTNWTSGMKVSGDVIITAVFTPVKNSYAVTFVNGDRTTTEMLEYGTEIVLPEPVKTATSESTYLFVSWTGWSDGMTVTGDVTLKANFTSVLTVDNDNLGDLTDDDGKIVIGDDGSESVGVSTDTLDAVKDEMDGNSDTKGLEIKTQDGSVTLDADVIGYIKDKLDERNEAVLTVNMARMDNALLSDVIRSVVGDRPVYSITMNTMSTFGDGKLKISLKYDLLENEDPEKILIWHISETGSVTAHPCTYSNGYVYFETTHLSYYFVGYDDSSEPMDDGFPMEYIIGIAAVAIIAIMAVVFLRKN